MEELTYKIETFEGPLDLLLALIMKNKMDICDIRISVIFDQYMEYLEKMRAMDMEIAGEFIVMASELMFIKSRMLLPKIEPEEEDPRERLAQALLEYRRAKEAASYFEEQFAIYGRRMAKETDELPSDDHYIAQQDIRLLEEALARLLTKKEVRRAEPMSTISPIIQRVIVPIPAMLQRIVKKLHTVRRTEFETLFSEASSRAEVVATFIALLSLIKEGHVTIEKNITWQENAAEPTEELYCTLKDEEGALSMGDALSEFE